MSVLDIKPISPVTERTRNEETPTKKKRRFQKIRTAIGRKAKPKKKQKK